MRKVRLGFVPSHRYPFDEDWAIEMRRRSLEALRTIEGIEVIAPSVGLIHNGLVRDDAGAKATVNLFAERGVQGVVIGTMTFGDEISAVSVAEALDVPVLVFGTQEGPFTADGGRRSDSFCGTLSVTSGLYRRKIPYLFAGIVWPEDEAFKRAVGSFARACAAVEGFYGARVGMVGLRPDRFETCAINEVALIQRFRQRVVQINLPEGIQDGQRMAPERSSFPGHIGGDQARGELCRLQPRGIVACRAAGTHATALFPGTRASGDGRFLLERRARDLWHLRLLYSGPADGQRPPGLL